MTIQVRQRYKNPNPKGTQSKRTLEIERLLLAGVPPVNIYEHFGIGRGVVAGVAFRMRERGITLPKVIGRWTPEKVAEYFSAPPPKQIDPDIRKLIIQTLIEHNNSLAIRKMLAEKYELKISQIDNIALLLKAHERGKANPVIDVTPRPGKPMAAAVTLPSEVGTIMAPLAINENIDAVTILTIKNNQCRYPIGRINDTHHFCGDEVKKSSSYCEHHHGIVWIPPKHKSNTKSYR